MRYRPSRKKPKKRCFCRLTTYLLPAKREEGRLSFKFSYGQSVPRRLLMNTCVYLMYVHILYLVFLIVTFAFQLVVVGVLPSAIFWTSRGHRCRPFSPPIRASISITHTVQHSQCSSMCIECCYLTHALTLSAIQFILKYATKSPCEHAR